MLYKGQFFMLNREKKTTSTFASPILLFVFDLFVANLAHLVIALIENNFDFSALNKRELWLLLPISAVVFCVFYLVSRIFRISWEYSSTSEFFRICFSSTFSSAASVGILLLLCKKLLISLAGVLLMASVTLLASVAARIFIRHRNAVRRVAQKSKILAEGNGIHDFGKTLIVGAGGGAQYLLREIRSNAFFENCEPVCAVDDDVSKKGFLVFGVRVEGTVDDIPSLCLKHSVKTIFLAIPSLSGSRRREIVEKCILTGAEVHTMPGIDEILMKPSEIRVKKVQIEDLLGRDPINIDVERVMDYVENKTVVVTGAGGSIGSELCRQIALHSPKKLIIFDIYENNAYDILNEIKRNYPSLDVEAYIGSVRDYVRLEQLFIKYSPDIVYHAAAHKHVPLMEDSPNEAVKNNVFGTLNTVRAADRAGVGRFVLISTDKAVNPTNVMGATKRMCEMIVQAYNKKSRTEYVAVRFGNVLGSNGSVIPLFERQISEGGPVTVTHPDIIRYFMTIPEAVSLVLQAGATASGGEIFVLDMGEPVKIVDLARNMIRLSGFEPERDIEIKFTGLRPGEKLYEELLMDEEGLKSTDNKLIHIGQPIDFDEDVFFSRLEELEKVMADDSADIRSYISELVPTYKNLNKVNN